MTDSAFPDRLAQLRAKWDADPTSRVFLQLAEEYRHLGRVKEALEVLDRGLREHPGYLSALVAKGRCHLELSEGEPARVVLERVVKQDATQMVANKLLVRAYLETGEPAKARERLDLYSLLNDSDPEIEELRRRIKSLDRPVPAEEPRPMDADPFSLEPPAARREAREARPAAADVFDIDLAPPPSRLPRPPLPAGDEIFALETPAPAPTPEAAEPDDLPFPGLASRDHHRRYLEGLAAEGLFAFAAPAPEPAASLPPPLPIPAIPPAAPATPALPATIDESSWLEEASVTTYALSPVESDEVPLFTAPAPAEPAEEDLWGEAPAEPAPAAAPEPEPEPEPEPTATATLGEIYLRQGYLAEAERIFQEVLQREPDNAAAHAGLAHLARLQEAAKAPEPVPAPEPAPAPSSRPEAPPLDARQLLAGFQPGPGEAGVTARKVFVLKSYLTRLRGGSAHVS